MKDLLLDGNNGLMIDLVKGDFVTGQSDLQNINLLILLPKGSLKQSPLCGYGVRKDINATMNSSTRAANERELRLQLAADGYEPTTCEIVVDANNVFEDIIIECPPQP